MRNIALFFLIICTINTKSYAQYNVVKDVHFDHIVWDFGKINEDGGVVSHTFRFVYKGNDWFIIKKVEASCGCTTFEYPEKPLFNEQEGYIKVSFDPNGRPGGFKKKISIYGFNDEEIIYLNITGTVAAKTRCLPTIPDPKEQDKTTASYPLPDIDQAAHRGRLSEQRRSTQRIDDKVKSRARLSLPVKMHQFEEDYGEYTTLTFILKNTGTDTLYFSDLQPHNVSFQWKEKYIPPHSQREIGITIQAIPTEKDTNFAIGYIGLVCNDPVQPYQEIRLLVNCLHSPGGTPPKDVRK